LQKGSGHLKGSSLPGDLGNSVLAAHRDTHFHVLKHVEFGEAIMVERGARKFVYTVTGIRIVEPSDVSVLQETGGSTITLITCYPFSFIGPAPQRFVVQAMLLEESRNG
jgi:sortase A